jgi:hypothetical protein
MPVANDFASKEFGEAVRAACGTLSKDRAACPRSSPVVCPDYWAFITVCPATLQMSRLPAILSPQSRRALRLLGCLLRIAIE